MASTYRTRARTRAVGTFGTKGTYPGGDGVGPAIVQDEEQCYDWTMPAPYDEDHTLHIIRTRTDPYRFTGYARKKDFYGRPTNNWYACNNVCASYSLAHTPSVVDVTSAPDWNLMRTKALVNINPYKPHVDVPVMLFELKDIPRMIKHAGDILGNLSVAKVPEYIDIAGSYLAYSFGWKPLVSDLYKLFNFVEEYEKRKAYFRRLKDGTHLHRTIAKSSVDSYLGSYQFQPDAYSDLVWRFFARRRLDEKIWYTANAEPRYPSDFAPTGIPNAAHKSLYGFQFSWASLWEAFPWSWLIDYFVNVQELLLARETLAHLKITRLNLMCSQRQTTYASGLHVGSGYGAKGSGTTTITHKYRVPVAIVSPLPTFREFLTPHQWGILGSLAATIALGGKGWKS